MSDTSNTSANTARRFVIAMLTEIPGSPPGRAPLPPGDSEVGRIFHVPSENKSVFPLSPHSKEASLPIDP